MFFILCRLQPPQKGSNARCWRVWSSPSWKKNAPLVWRPPRRLKRWQWWYVMVGDGGVACLHLGTLMKNSMFNPKKCFNMVQPQKWRFGLDWLDDFPFPTGWCLLWFHVNFQGCINGQCPKKWVWGSFLKQAIGELHVERFGCTKAFIGQAPSKG